VPLTDKDVSSDKVESAKRRRNRLKNKEKETEWPDKDIDASDINKHKKRQKEWIEGERHDLESRRERIRQETERSSDFGLRFVILVWIAIVAAIFYHVYNVIMIGGGSSTRSSVSVAPSSAFSNHHRIS